MSMKPTQGKRAWVKLWTTEWLDGTTRYQMTDAQRAFWIDLLAMAGRSRIPGIICAGRDEDCLVGYPLNRFSSLMAGPIDVEATFALFERTGKVKITITSEGPPKLFSIALLNWKKYQSDLDAQAERARNYRSRKKQSSGSVTSASRDHHATVTVRHAGEVEEETETEIEREKRQRQTKEVSASAPSPAIITQAFYVLGHKPFGPKEFQTIWAQEWSAVGADPNWTDVMEQTIQRCKSMSVKVPGLFYKHKHAIETGEVQMRYKATPL